MVKTAKGSKKNKKPPIPAASPALVPEPPVKILSTDVRSVIGGINPDSIKGGFYIKVRKQVKNPRSSGAYMFGYVRGDGIESEDVRDAIPEEVILERWGTGIYRLNFYTPKKEIIDIAPGVDHIDVAVGEIEPVEKNTSPGQDRQPNNNSTKPSPGSSASNISAREDVQDKRANVEKLRLTVEEEKLNKELKRITGDGGDGNNKDLDLRIKLAMNEISDKFNATLEKALSVLKPAGDSELKQMVIALQNDLKESKAKSEQNTLLSTLIPLIMNNQKSMTESQLDMLKQIMNQKESKSKSDVDSFKEMLDLMGIKRKWDKEDREDREYNFMPQDTPPVEEPFWKGVITGIVDFVKDLNKDGMLTQKLTNMKDPPVLPQPGKTYTEAEEDATIKRLVGEAVEKHKKSLPPVSVAEPGTVAAIPAKKSIPDTNVRSAVPDGETLEVFNAKKKVFNEFLSKLVEESILCPLAPDWVGLALGKLPEDSLRAILAAEDWPQVMPILEKYADAEIVSRMKAAISSDPSPEKKKAAWISAGFNTLKAAIAEALNIAPDGETKPADAVTAPGAVVTTDPGVPAVTATQ